MDNVKVNNKKVLNDMSAFNTKSKQGINNNRMVVSPIQNHNNYKNSKITVKQTTTNKIKSQFAGPVTVKHANNFTNKNNKQTTGNNQYGNGGDKYGIMKLPNYKFISNVKVVPRSEWDNRNKDFQVNNVADEAEADDINYQIDKYNNRMKEGAEERDHDSTIKEFQSSDMVHRHIALDPYYGTWREQGNDEATNNKGDGGYMKMVRNMVRHYFIIPTRETIFSRNKNQADAWMEYKTTHRDALQDIVDGCQRYINHTEGNKFWSLLAFLKIKSAWKRERLAEVKELKATVEEKIRALDDEFEEYKTTDEYKNFEKQKLEEEGPGWEQNYHSEY